MEEIQSNQTFVNYALEDSRACLRVYQELDAGFPEKERLLSSLTRRIASSGLAIDGPLCQQFIDKTDKILEETPKQTTEWRQANLANQTFEKLLMGQRSDRRVPTRLKYCGAPHTKRWSGGGVINFQAIPNDGIGDISARQCLKAPAGRVLSIGRPIADRTASDCIPGRRSRFPRPSQGRNRYIRGTWSGIQTIQGG